MMRFGAAISVVTVSHHQKMKSLGERSKPMVAEGLWGKISTVAVTDKLWIQNYGMTGDMLNELCDAIKPQVEPRIFT